MDSFYCQLDYAHVPYLREGEPHGNLSNNGCGVCAASMIAENLGGITLPPEECAKLAKASGARETVGTNFFILAPYLAQRAGLNYRVEWDPGKVLRFLQQKNGMVVANTQGDRKQDGYTGVFSDSGHYIVLAGAQQRTVKVWDPMYKQGSDRYDVPGRRGKVVLDGNDAYADFSVIEEDCRDRPYFLFEKADVPHKPPLIGLICGFINQNTTQYIYRVYTRPLLQAGGMPVLLSLDTPADMLEDTLSRLDGLLLTGGPDVNPRLYGEEPVPETDSPSKERDDLEMKAICLCRKQRKPILGICRGIQAMAVALGGALYQDLPSQHPSEVDHFPCKEGWGIRDAHPVIIEKGTRLEAIAGTGSWYVNSYHHQGVKTLPEGARVAARSPDGLTEALEWADGPLCLGVQWHPERLYEEDTHAFSLFRALVDAAKAGMLDQEGQP